MRQPVHLFKEPAIYWFCWFFSVVFASRFTDFHTNLHSFLLFALDLFCSSSSAFKVDSSTTDLESLQYFQL